MSDEKERALAERLTLFFFDRDYGGYSGYRWGIIERLRWWKLLFCKKNLFYDY